MNTLPAQPGNSAHETPRITQDGLRLALKRWLAVLFLGILPLVTCGDLIYHLTFVSAGNVNKYWDYRVFWNAGREVLHGHSPYPVAKSSVLARENAFVYPAPAALLTVPLALLPFELSATLYALILVAALPLALRIVGVRDLRCYGVVLLTAPINNAIGVGAISPLLVVIVAVIWRYRDRRWVAALGLACAVTLKVFLWPLILWFAFTRRVETAVRAVGLIVVSTVAAWAVLGFNGFLDYPHVLLLLDRLLDGKGYSLVALGRSLGVNATVARSFPWIVGALLLTFIAFRGRQVLAERQTFGLAVGATLALSPIIWLHYFVLLFIPIALASPRLSLLWAVPLALWAVPGQSIQRPLWQPQPRKIIPLQDTARVGDAPLIICAVVVTTAVLLLAWRAAGSSRSEQPV